MNWTDERIDLLKKLWKEGLSAAKIAKTLGGATRNAVIGKVHRLKLKEHGEQIPTPVRIPKTTTAATVIRRLFSQDPASDLDALQEESGPTRETALMPMCDSSVMAEKNADPPPRQVRKRKELSSNNIVPISRKLQLVQLEEKVCRWPNGDPLSENFGFCGNDSVQKGPYCTYHARIAFQPASERRRAR